MGRPIYAHSEEGLEFRKTIDIIIECLKLNKVNENVAASSMLNIILQSMFDQMSLQQVKEVMNTAIDEFYKGNIRIYGEKE